MSFENNHNQENPAELFSEMMNIWVQIQQLGRNDVEMSTGLEIIRQVQNGEITPRKGRDRMRALLEGKQIH